MLLFDFKGGTGMASRKLAADDGGYTLGVLVQANFGYRRHLLIAGAPVGKELSCDRFPCRATAPRTPDAREGSIIIVVATDAPLVGTQLKRIARRAALGIARTGSMSGNGSGDIFIAFSTASPGADRASGTTSVTMLSNRRMDALFEAAVFATEEAVINALVAAETMTGRDYHQTIGFPTGEVQRVLQKYGRLEKNR